MYRHAAKYIQSCTKFQPEIGIILGSGFGEIAELIQAETVIHFSKIPGFPVSTVHKGNLIFGILAGKKVACMQGRVHFYEGYSMNDLAIPVQTLYALGVKKLVIVSAVGGICPDYYPGEVVAISDHIKLDLDSTLRGRNPEELGTRFFDMTAAYDPQLRSIAQTAAKELGLNLPEGVYAYMGGPQFETPAEIRMLRLLGADMVGMSTVPEVITAAHCGMKVLAFGCITNMAAGMENGGLNRDVIATAEKDGKAIVKQLLEKVVGKL